MIFKYNYRKQERTAELKREKHGGCYVIREAEGEGRAMKATEMAISNPLIDDYTLKGAKGLLVNITGGKDLKLFEVDEVVNKIRSEVEADAEVIIGAILFLIIVCFISFNYTKPNKYLYNKLNQILKKWKNY